MVTSEVQIKLSKDVRLLKAIEPTHLWTFDCALSLLKTCEDPYTLQALDEFLLLNYDLLLSPNPFERAKSEGTHAAGEFTLRNILYTNINENSIKDSKKISELLDLDQKEILRIISQTNDRIPEKKTSSSTKLNSKLPDDRQRHIDNRRIYLGASRVLRERRTILQLAAELLNNKNNTDASSTAQNIGREIYVSESYVNRLISSLQSNSEVLLSRGFDMESNDKLDELLYKETILLTIEQMKVLIEILLQNPNIRNETISSWFSFMKSSNFMINLGQFIEYPESFVFLRALATIISLLLFDLDNVYGNDDDSYFNDPSTFSVINDAVTDTNNLNSIVMYAWTIILLRKSYILEEYSSEEKQIIFMKVLSLSDIYTSVSSLNSKCVDLNVFEEIQRVNELLKFDNIYPAILTSVILSALPIVTLTPSICSAIKNVLHYAPNSVVQRFFENESTENAIILSRAKFPLVMSPFLQLASINGFFAFNELRELKSYMCSFDTQYFSGIYELDDENTELIRLSKNVDIYPPYELNQRLSLVLNAGTKAKVLPSLSSDKTLVTFLYNYNGWALLGRVIQNVSKVFDSTNDEKVDLIINVLDLLAKSVSENDPENAKLIFEYMSAYTDNSDIVEVIIRLFEQALHSRNIRFLESTLNFFAASIDFIPNRLWSYFHKSSLFTNGGQEGFAYAIYGTYEMVNGSYEFTISLIKFTHALIKNYLTLDDKYPISSKTSILEKFISHLISVFESFIHCKFNYSYQKLEMGVLILDVFSSIIAVQYGIEGGKQGANRISDIFSSSTDKIIESFLASNTDYSRTTHPILSMIDSFEYNMNDYEIYDISGFWYENWIKTCLTFSKLIVSIRTAANLNPSSFERSLFGKLPLLVNAYAHHQKFKIEILDLITSLTKGKWPNNSIPSLLSHLGREHSQVLLHSLASDLDNQFQDNQLKICHYNFICAILEGNQEGLSVLFINGRDVFDDFSDRKNQNSEGKKSVSLLKILKKLVRDTKYYSNSVNIHLIETLALAFNSWSTARENENDLDFVKELINIVKTPMVESPNSIDDYVSGSYNFMLLSKIGEILSLILFTTRNEQCQKNIIELVKSDFFSELLKKVYHIKNHEPFAHEEIEKEFQKKYPGFTLGQFSCPALKRNEFDVSNFYSIDLMDKLFGSSYGWNEVREKIIFASTSYQYLNAQFSVCKSFGALLTAMAKRFPLYLDEKLLDFVIYLLQINVSEGIPTSNYKFIYQERIELSFFLHYTLFTKTNLKINTRSVLDIVKLSYDVLESDSLNFLQNITRSTGDYRSLLRLLYISLNHIKDEYDELAEYGSILRGIFDLVITKATRNLMIEIQNDVYHCKHEDEVMTEKMCERLDDLKLILSILKIFVRMKFSKNLHYEMATLVEQNGTAKIILNLITFSHLIMIKKEFVFVQLGLIFLQDLLVIDTIAEKLVSSGLLVALVQSKFSIPIQNGNVSSLASTPYHRLWVNGILPILTSILSRQGSSIFPEICLTIQAFSKQIESCIDSWSKDSSSMRITSATIAETSQILLLFKLLEAYKEAGYLVEVSGHESPNDVDLALLPGLDSEMKRSDFADRINNLLKHPKFLSSRIVPCSPDEEIFMKDDQSYEAFVIRIIDEIKEFKNYLD
ncbi:Piso0_004130 [Millerozyma farinosa CBS 7064]|uniref:Nucleoporin NUP188 n=1 Tax=Pichia sorbitophila (strain ATCC MYA-4447 / BCRC 22081 / CBS 7064 / NBRC 10061 / NRRL Y-12695) TaxID=559304 RepID=G8Y7K2_PICSO|nr:Piso0_004130 [Millerozyma farinosa CBS 7064]CCE84582.1 Piso0_004130 [Millerozyma farinosa CBS 7064]